MAGFDADVTTSPDCVIAARLPARSKPQNVTLTIFGARRRLASRYGQTSVLKSECFPVVCSEAAADILPANPIGVADPGFVVKSGDAHRKHLLRPYISQFGYRNRLHDLREQRVGLR